MNTTSPTLTAEAQRNSRTTERKLLVKLIHDSTAYQRVKHQVCPFDAYGKNRAQTFVYSAYNVLFVAIATEREAGETGIISKDTLKNRIIDWHNGGNENEINTKDILFELDNDFYSGVVPGNEFFHTEYAAWIDKRIGIELFEYIDNIKNTPEGKNLSTLKTLVDSAVNCAVSGNRVSNFKTGTDVFRMDREELTKNELLKDGFLSRGGGLTIASTTGAGKSVLLAQLAISWALGRTCLGIEPNGVLRSIVVQSENDDTDLFDSFDGVAQGLELNDALKTTAGDNMRVYRETELTGAELFTRLIEPAIAEFKPDVIFIDPVFGFLGSDANNQEAVSDFLRQQLNPMLLKYNCGAILMHHVPRPSRTNNAASWSSTDHAYAAHGSAEFANWSRAILSLNKTKQPGLFELIGAKRGHKLRWEDGNGEPTLKKFIAWNREGGYPFWREPAPDTLDKLLNEPDNKDVTLISGLIGEDTLKKSALIESATDNGIGKHRARTAIEYMIEAGTLLEIKKGKEIHVCKHSPELN